MKVPGRERACRGGALEGPETGTRGLTGQSKVSPGGQGGARSQGVGGGRGRGQGLGSQVGDGVVSAVQTCQNGLSRGLSRSNSKVSKTC